MKAKQPMPTLTETEKYHAYQNAKLEEKQRRKGNRRRMLTDVWWVFWRLGCILLICAAAIGLINVILGACSSWFELRQDVVSMQNKVKNMDRDYARALLDAYNLQQRQIDEASNTLYNAFDLKLTVRTIELGQSLQMQIKDATNQLMLSPDRLKPLPDKPKYDTSEYTTNLNFIWSIKQTNLVQFTNAYIATNVGNAFVLSNVLYQGRN